MTAIKLTKDTKISLTKENPALKSLRVEIGWEKLVRSVDVDVSVFGLNSAGKGMESHLVFFNQTESKDKAIKHSGDNRVGGEGTVEAVSLQLDALLNTAVSEVSIVLTIDRALERGHNMGSLTNCWCKLINSDTGEILREYDMDAQFGTSISVQIGSLVRDQLGWSFKEVAVGYPDKSFEDIAHAYGF